MKLHAMGIDYRHSEDFSIERPDGSGDNLLLIFKTQAQVRIESEYMTYPADSAILYTADNPQFYRAAGKEFVNHWVHFDAGDSKSFLDRIRLPVNTVFRISDIVSAENILLQLNLESVTESPNKDESINLLLRLLLAKLGGTDEKNEHHTAHYAALSALRAEIYRNPARKCSISDFASNVSLSPSHFQALYKAEFGVSCYEDVLVARIDMAKYYLRSTTLSVGRIAELCGYENDVHFIRQFRLRTGMTAGQYRQRESHSVNEVKR